MAGWGEKIPNISVEQLQERLLDEDDGKAVRRLVTAIEYKNGASPAQIQAKYDIPRATVYTWLNRFEERGLDAALHDIPKPGQESKLTPDEWNKFQAVLHESPQIVGFNAQAWDSTLARQYIQEEFGVEYPPRHVRRLMEKAGLS